MKATGALATICTLVGAIVVVLELLWGQGLLRSTPKTEPQLATIGISSDPKNDSSPRSNDAPQRTGAPSHPRYTDLSMLPERLPSSGGFRHYWAPVAPEMKRVEAYPIDLMEQEGLTPMQMGLYCPSYCPALPGTKILGYRNAIRLGERLVDWENQNTAATKYLFVNRPNHSVTLKGPSDWWLLQSIDEEPVEMLQCWNLDKESVRKKLADLNR